MDALLLALLDLLALGGWLGVRHGRRIARLGRTCWALWHVPPLVPPLPAGELVPEAERFDFAREDGSP